METYGSIIIWVYSFFCVVFSWRNFLLPKVCLPPWLNRALQKKRDVYTRWKVACIQKINEMIWYTYSIMLVCYFMALPCLYTQSKVKQLVWEVNKKSEDISFFCFCFVGYKNIVIFGILCSINVIRYWPSLIFLNSL